jgi:hypothetical protein
MSTIKGDIEVGDRVRYSAVNSRKVTLALARALLSRDLRRKYIMPLSELNKRDVAISILFVQEKNVR